MKDKNKLGLVERDLNLMRVAYEEQFLRTKTISHYFFHGSIPAASRRISKLISWGLVRQENLSLPGRHHVIRVSVKGARELGDFLKFKCRQKKKIPIATYVHDCLTAEVRLSLKKYFDAEWIPENAMKATDLKKIPDGVFVFQSGCKIAIEVENTLKAKSRYEKMWREWETPDFLLVLYVASNPSLFRSLQKRMLAFQTTKVCFGLILSSDLIDGIPETVWTPKGSIPLFSRRTY